MESISSVNILSNQQEYIKIEKPKAIENTSNISKEFVINEKKSFFDNTELLPINKIKEEEIAFANYMADIEKLLNTYNEKEIEKLKVEQLKQNDFDIKNPFEVNNKNYDNFTTRNISEQLDNLIKSFKEFIKLRSDLNIYETKRNDLLKARSEGLSIQESLIVNYDSLINQITKKIGGSKKDYFFDTNNANKMIEFANKINKDINNGLNKNESITNISNEFLKTKNHFSELLTSTHNLLESIEKVKKI